MRTLPSGIVAALANRRYNAAHLLEITGGATTLRWTDAPFSVVYGGNTYAKLWFSVGDVVIDDDDSQHAELTFHDINKVVRGLLLTEDWSYRPCTLREVWFGDGDVLIDTFILADGRIEPVSANLEDPQEPVVLAIVPEQDAEGSPGPAQSFGGSCRYLGTSGFKGLQCGYAGAATTCDGARATCISYGNHARYGGFPFAPEVGSVIRVGSVEPVTIGSRR